MGTVGMLGFAVLLTLAVVATSEWVMAARNRPRRAMRRRNREDARRDRRRREAVRAERSG